MTTAPTPTALEDLLQRARLAFDARAVHTGADAGAHAAATGSVRHPGDRPASNEKTPQ